MSKRNVIIAKSDRNFDAEIKKIIAERMSKGLDKRWAGRALIERKAMKSQYWKGLVEELKIARFLPEEDGQAVVFNWFTIIAVSFFAIMMFAGLIYAMGLINNALLQAGALNEVNAGQPGYTNMTLAAQETFGQANGSIQNLRLVALTLIFSLFLATILMNFAVKIHPAWFFVYILIVVLAIIMSAPVSNAYQNLMQTDLFGGILPSFTGANYFMINLPVFVAVGGILGGIFLFINIIKNPNEGGLK